MTSMHEVLQLLMCWEDDKVRVEIGRIVTALRRAVVLRLPMSEESRNADSVHAGWRRRWSEVWVGVQDVEI